MTDPKYPDGAPEWYKPYMICEFSDDGETWTKPFKALYTGKRLEWVALESETELTCYIFARPVKPWTPRVGEEVIAWDDKQEYMVMGLYYSSSGPFSEKHIISGCYCDHVARLHNEDGSCIDVSGGIEAIKTRTPWV